MTQPKQLIADQRHGRGFYPTPPTLAEKMLDGIDWYKISSVLEPSAGKGDLAEAITRTMAPYNHELKERKLTDAPRPEDRRWIEVYHYSKAPIDCVEVDINLRHILAGKGFKVVHDDFLTFDTQKRYDLIAMNPPFDRGDEHLLHALELQERHGGCVICLLNAETLRNAHTYRREVLKKKLDELGAEIQYVSNAFSDAERETDVEIAIVKAIVPAPDRPSIIIDQLHKEDAARPARHISESSAIAKGDFIQAIIDRYNFEVRAGLRLIEEYNAIQPYLLDSVESDETHSASPTMTLIMGSGYASRNEEASENAYMQAIRAKYWEALFTDNRFTSQLTSNLADELRGRVEQLRDYDFSEYNILTLRAQLAQQLVSGVEATILTLFDDWTHKYHYGEYSQNRYLYDGWKTNEAWRVGRKVITPLYGHSPFSDWSNTYDPVGYYVVRHLNDIEKVFRYLDAGDTEPIDLIATLRDAKATRQTRKIKLTYFYVTFYKKGTLHIEFHDQAILHKFNLYGSQRKGWLPPSYGKKQYKDMSPDEKRVIDSFEGEDSYKAVMKRADFFLSAPKQALLETTADREGATA